MERDATSTTNEKTYPRWLWRIVDEFDRWAADRLPMVQSMILQAVGKQKLPQRTEKEAKAIARSTLKGLRDLDKELKRGPFKTKRAEKKRQEKIKRLRSEHYCSGKGVVSDDKPRSPADKVAYLARVHDVMVEKDAGRRRRKRWAPVAPKFSDDAQGVAQEIDFVTLFAVESIPPHVEDHNATGSSEIERCWQEVPEQVAAMEGATAGTGQHSEGGSLLAKATRQVSDEGDTAKSGGEAGQDAEAGQPCTKLNVPDDEVKADQRPPTKADDQTESPAGNADATQADTTPDGTSRGDGLSDKAAETKPDDQGYVAKPADPSAYLAAETILADHSEGLDMTLTYKRLGEIVEDYEKNGVRWTRPIGKTTGQPVQNRRSVHLSDWLMYVKQFSSGGLNDEGFPKTSADEIQKRAAETKAKGLGGR